jgi:hypothetical protein
MVKRDKKLSLFFYPDIYNKLYIMIKQTWEISNEERNRILSLHESATKNLYLMSEQLVSVRQQRSVDRIISSKDPNVVKYLSSGVSPAQYARRIGVPLDPNNKDRWAQTGLRKLREMEKFMDETSLEVFEQMRVQNPMFYLYVISHYLGKRLDYDENIFGLEKRNTSWAGSDFSDWNLKDKKIIVDNSVTIQEEITPPEEGKASEPVMEQGYSLITPPEVQQPMLFEYNEAVMTPGFIQYINETIFGGIDQAIKEMSDELVKEGRKPADVWVNKLKITSSSSTIPNGKSERTFPGKVPTFQELSDERAKVVYNYLIEGLKKRNATINPQGVEIDSKGTNAGKQITVKSGNQTIKLDGTGTSGPEYNGQNREELKKYQRVDFTFDFAVKGTTPPKSDPIESDPIPPQLIPTSQTDFIVRFSGTGRKRYKVRIPQITLPNISLKGLFAKRGVLPCYYY